MRSPTAGLLWEIWRPHRRTAGLIAGLTVAGRLVDSSTLTTLLGMVAFLLLFAVFNYTDTTGGRGVGRFPRRLFTLPVTTRRLVAVPMLAGVASIELLYLLWLEPLSSGGSTSPLFTAVLLAALMVFYLAVLWTFERAGSFRLVVLGVIASTVFAIGLLPSFPPSPPPAWRSEPALAAFVASLAVATFLLTWRRVARLRAGGGRGQRAGSLFGWMAEVIPARRKAFASAASAHFWFEWRSSGIVLPALVAGIVLVVAMPISWLVRGDEADTFRLLLAVLAAPVVLAIPVGVAFSKPTFWSEDLAVPAFVAVRPLSSEDLVAIKVRVAAVSAAASWLVVLLFLTVWLSSWARIEFLRQFGVQVWALVPLAGMFLTWRCLVSRLWSGLSGRRAMFVASVVSLAVLVIGGLAFDAGRLPGWLLADPARLGPVVWIAAVLVIAKYWLAAYAWRGVAPRHLRAYLLAWLAGTVTLVTLGIVVWGMVRIYLPLDVERARTVVILLALMAIPLARVGLAPSRLTRNRHR